jgi:predicted PurR-regulated permease PerM
MDRDVCIYWGLVGFIVGLFLVGICLAAVQHFHPEIASYLGPDVTS